MHRLGGGAALPLTRLLASLTWRDRRARFVTFARAELSSRYDLLAAANRTSDPEVAAQLLRHAADEARHARAFYARAVELGERAPLRADYEHLYERLGERRFFAFVHLGEARAVRQFNAWIPWLGAGKDQRALQSVLPDEQRHAAYTRALAGSLGEAALWEAWRSWRRAGRVVTGALYTACCVLIYGVMGLLKPGMRD